MYIEGIGKSNEDIVRRTLMAFSIIACTGLGVFLNSGLKSSCESSANERNRIAIWRGRKVCGCVVVGGRLAEEEGDAALPRLTVYDGATQHEIGNVLSTTAASYKSIS